MRIGEQRIRKVFYFGTITLVIFQLIILNSIFFRNLKIESDLKLTQLSTGIYDMKKIYLKEVVDRTMQEIKLEEKDVITELDVRMNDLIKITNHLISHHFEKYQMIEEFQHIGEINKEISILAYERSSKKILVSVNFVCDVSKVSEKDFLELSKDFILKKMETVEEMDIILVFGVTKEKTNQIIKERTKNIIRNIRLIDNGYIWINEVINYEGGDDYAIRLVHPNLPDTEGSFLSTKTEDIKGNLPYLTELNGIKNNGEILYEYYFKKMNSDKIAHKLTYAKLYPEYNWIIATGMYLDDLDKLISIESKRMNESYNKVLVKTGLTTLICLILSIVIIFIFEKKINALIGKYTYQIEKDKKILEKIAFLDPLTNIYNRRYMIQKIQEKIDISNMGNKRFCIGICDLDSFKSINDTYGHQAGDYILVECTKIFKKSLSKDDFVARWGGEEFLFLLDIPTIDLGIQKLENLRKIIENKNFEFEGKIIKCTVSFGITIKDENIDNHERLIKESDYAMYKAKETGKNKTVPFKLF